MSKRRFKVVPRSARKMNDAQRKAMFAKLGEAMRKRGDRPSRGHTPKHATGKTAIGTQINFDDRYVVVVGGHPKAGRPPMRSNKIVRMSTTLKSKRMKLQDAAFKRKLAKAKAKESGRLRLLEKMMARDNRDLELTKGKFHVYRNGKVVTLSPSKELLRSTQSTGIPLVDGLLQTKQTRTGKVNAAAKVIKYRRGKKKKKT